jgi:hypothetical protein
MPGLFLSSPISLSFWLPCGFGLTGTTMMITTTTIFMEVNLMPRKSLMVTVRTYNSKNEQIGHRIVDMYHKGTPTWIQSHMMWAAHNGNIIDIETTSEEELAEVQQMAEQAAAMKAV